MHEQALKVWQDATEFYSKSYLAWLTYINLLMSVLFIFALIPETDLTFLQRRKGNLYCTQGPQGSDSMRRNRPARCDLGALDLARTSLRWE
jgi:hypothetical protein